MLKCRCLKNLNLPLLGWSLPEIKLKLKKCGKSQGVSCFYLFITTLECKVKAIGDVLYCNYWTDLSMLAILWVMHAFKKKYVKLVRLNTIARKPCFFFNRKSLNQKIWRRRLGFLVFSLLEMSSGLLRAPTKISATMKIDISFLYWIVCRNVAEDFSTCWSLEFWLTVFPLDRVN